MKRLVCCNVAGIINTPVINYYGLECNEQRSLADLDRQTAYAIRQAMKCIIRKKHSEAKENHVNQFVSCAVSYIMHMEPEIARH